MPNHVKNIVRMEGITNLPLFTEEDGVMCFDFNKVIPMPESLDMEHGFLTDIAIEAVIRKLNDENGYHFLGRAIRGRMSDDEFLQRLHGRTEDELAKIGLRYIANKVLYGATTWYDWRVENWGTKWNAYSNMQEDENTISFETAWMNPESVMLKLSEMYPDALIEHWWADEDSGSNSGHRVYKGGQIIEGDYCEQRSNEAYEIYIKCWGESECLAQDEEGNWYHKDCDTCDGCGYRKKEENEHGNE